MTVRGDEGDKAKYHHVDSHIYTQIVPPSSVALVCHRHIIYSLLNIRRKVRARAKKARVACCGRVIGSMLQAGPKRNKRESSTRTGLLHFGIEGWESSQRFLISFAAYSTAELVWTSVYTSLPAW